MKAMQENRSKQGSALIAAELSQPQPGKGELLIRVRAAGVTPTELQWYPTIHTKDGAARSGAVPGHEFSGIVAALGENTSGFKIGQEVYGMSDWFADGATAEFCLTQPENIAPKPVTLSHEAAATVPIGALTSWQGLLDRAKIQPGESVLVQGGSGSVGLFAVQLAHLHGAHVIATVTPNSLDLVAGLGAEKVIDYKTSRFEDKIDKVDVVFDAVGGETLNRSWSVLKPGGRMVTIAADVEGTSDKRAKGAFFIVEPNQKQLIEVTKLLDAGKLKTFINAVVPLKDASLAYEGATHDEHGYGKVVITIPEGGSTSNR